MGQTPEKPVAKAEKAHGGCAVTASPAEEALALSPHSRWREGHSGHLEAVGRVLALPWGGSRRLEGLEQRLV